MTTKVKSLLFSLLCFTVFSISFTSCSDDENPLDDTGSKIELPQTRAFILNEGSYNGNNAGLAFYDVEKKKVIDDLFYQQNTVKLGDTGQDMIVYNNNIYVTVYGSKYITRLNAAGVEQKRYSFSEADGAPRYMAAANGKIYVTLYSGKVACMNAETLEVEKYATVGNNPEHILIKGDYAYVVNSGWGNDNRLSIINLSTMAVENVTVSYNQDVILLSNNKIYIQGYGAKYPDYTYAVEYYDEAAKTVTTIGKASKIAAYRNTLYLVYSETDWNTHTNKTTFTSYNTETNKLSNSSFLKDAPEALATASVYMIEVNPNNGDIYIGTSDYKTNGTIYHFKNDGTFVNSFDCGGVSPNNMVFFN